MSDHYCEKHHCEKKPITFTGFFLFVIGVLLTANLVASVLVLQRSAVFQSSEPQRVEIAVTGSIPVVGSIPVTGQVDVCIKSECCKPEEIPPPKCPTIPKMKPKSSCCQ